MYKSHVSGRKASVRPRNISLKLPLEYAMDCGGSDRTSNVPCCKSSQLSNKNVHDKLLSCAVSCALLLLEWMGLTTLELKVLC